MNKNVISVIDGEAGSCGKAKVVGEIATDREINLGASVTNCMPNAGHTFVDEKGQRTVFRNIPVSVVNPNTELFIGPGSAIDMTVFIDEYDKVEKYLGTRKIYVHEMVPLIEEKHRRYERDHVKSGSTFKGCGAVSKDKIMRDPELDFFRSYKNAVVCSNDEWLDRLYSHLDKSDEYVMLEGAQGCDLSLNHSGNYPHVTSRNVSTAQLFADCGISVDRLLETIMVIRPFPIRISNLTRDGQIRFSGRYGTGEELTWSQINIASQEGLYPFSGDISSLVYDFDICLDQVINDIILMYFSLPKMYKMQLFGNGYTGPDWGNLSLLEALEIERLFHKNTDYRVYQSIILRKNDEEYFICDLSEDTTVTRMERRVFDLDISKLKNNIRINNPYGLYLNFFQQLSQEYSGMKGNVSNFSFDKNTIERYVDWLEGETGKEILAFGTGPRNNERILVKSLLKK